MIRKINLKQFKGFKDEEFELRPLTLLAGINGVGKSTLCQSILFLVQNGGLQPRSGHIYGKTEYIQINPTTLHTTFTTENRYILNGSLVQLGLAGDILYERFDEKMIGIEISVDSNKFSPDNQPSAGLLVGNPTNISLNYEFSFESKEQEYLLLISNPYYHHQQQSFLTYADLMSNFFYLSADRLGPQDFYPTSYEEVLHKESVGIRGEFASQYLKEHSSRKIDFPKLIYEGKKATSTLGEQVNLWMSIIRPGIKIEANSVAEFSLHGLRYRFTYPGDQSNAFRPHNVGFGISYLLPLFVSILGARQPSIFIIENPESHIHPKGQAEIGRFLALAASAGHQIIVETHSDHILNGIRVAIKDKVLTPEQTQFLFFHQTSHEGSPDLTADSITILPNGKLYSRPSGFFDEYDNQLSKLI